MSEPEQDNIVLESGADSVGQASPLRGIAPEVEEAREPVCTDPEGAKSCTAVAEGLRTAEPNEADIEDNGDTLEGNQQPVEAAEPMRSKPHVDGQMEKREAIDMEAFEEREGEGVSATEHPQDITGEREAVLESDAETDEENAVERSGEGAEHDIVHDDKHPPQSPSQHHQYAEKQPQTEESAGSTGGFPLDERGVSEDSGKDNSLEAVRRRLRESLGKRREGGNSGQGGRSDEL